MAVARNHHYVPQSYLAAFTDSGTKEGQLVVLEAAARRAFRTSPRNVAAYRDFNRIDVEGHPPDALETALGKVEDELIDAVRRILSGREYPNQVDLNAVLNLLGLLAVRTPTMREGFNAARERLVEIMAGLLVSDRKIFEHHVERAASDGYLPDIEVSFETMREFVRENKYAVEFSPMGNSRIEFAAFDKLLPILGRRSWSVLLAPDASSELVTCDRPVTLFNRMGGGPAGFGTPNTEVYFPLGPLVGLVGVFEHPLPEVVVLRPDGVATMNRRVFENAERFVFSASGKFAVKDDGHIQEIDCTVLLNQRS